MTDETPPTWAIERALELAGEKPEVAKDVVEHPHFYPQALAHATTLAKYEQQPVDPVALVLADYYEAIGLGRMGNDVSTGSAPHRTTALRTALEKHGMLK